MKKVRKQQININMNHFLLLNYVFKFTLKYISRWSALKIQWKILNNLFRKLFLIFLFNFFAIVLKLKYFLLKGSSSGSESLWKRDNHNKK